MITIIESPGGVRLNYNGKEVFNHTDIFPFIKFLEGKVVYGAKKRNLTASLNLEGSFAASSYEVLSTSIKKASIKFLGYKNYSVTVNCVDEKDRLILYFNPSDESLGLWLSFLSSAYETVYYNGLDIKGKKGNNLSPASVKLSEIIQGKIAVLLNRDYNALLQKANYLPLSVISDKGLSYSFTCDGYVEYDLSLKTINNYVFASYPKMLIVKEDDSLVKTISHELGV